MRAATLLSALASTSLATAAAVIAPRAAAPRNLKVISFSVFGSGCPYGSADVQADPSNTALNIQLSEYIVQSGPGVSAAEYRKNCKITLNLEYDSGFSLSTITTDLRGYADIPSDTKGQCQNTIYFSGEPQKASYGVTLPGGYGGPFSLRSDPDIVAWSPCGGSTAILNVNTQCSISSTNSRGLIAVDRISNKLAVRIALQWRSC
ncbi:hypothetical protein QBC37DRAFT_351456 [Rhypophila decipiens]|uniref:Secreted protein n=1 Tax=Rhypophila decipiens TaxID=261697 RepID=A0AAN7B466_9PEZI|nr:hypothetical protein QBC37DRAFT_351456 [Rhypophila decipiens]